jgi:hypothetical protein
LSVPKIWTVILDRKQSKEYQNLKKNVQKKTREKIQMENTENDHLYPDGQYPHILPDDFFEKHYHTWEVNPREYVDRYTAKYNELKLMFQPKTWAPVIIPSKLYVTRDMDRNPEVQAEKDFWKYEKVSNPHSVLDET